MDKEIEKLFDHQLVEITKKEEVQQNKMVVRELEKPHQSTYEFIQSNTVLVSFISVVFLPYMTGMLLTLFLFYFYMGIPVMDFFHVYSGLSQLVFWILGIYLIITLTDIWLILKKVFGRE